MRPSAAKEGLNVSRGESAKPRSSGPGLAIAGTLAVLVLSAACVVAWSLHVVPRWIQEMFSGPATPPPPPGDPAALVHAALSPLRFRECMEAGLGPAAAPIPGPAGEAARVHAMLVERGYAPGPDDPTPLALPYADTIHGLEGSCGVVLVARVGTTTLGRARAGTAPEVESWRGEVVTVGACDGDGLAVTGTGAIAMRVYAMPGITPEIVRRSGMPADALLAHAEAESYLRARGWEPEDSVIERRVARGAPSRVVRSLGPGVAPVHGCTAWVAVGLGIGAANVGWGAVGGEYDPGQARFMLGMLSCDASTTPTGGTDLTVTDAEGDGGRIFFRPYRARSGPAVVGPSALATGAATMRVKRARDVVLPTPIAPGPATN